MIKVFTLNKNNKIELTKEELERLLNEAFWEGYNKDKTYVYTSPHSYYYSTALVGKNSNTITNFSNETTIKYGE